MHEICLYENLIQQFTMFTIDNAPPSIVSPLRWQSVKVHNIHGKIPTLLLTHVGWEYIFVYVLITQIPDVNVLYLTGTFSFL